MKKFQITVLKNQTFLILLQELRGRHISLACFHGINFKSKSWALFSLKDPSISFVSDAQEIMEEKPGVYSFQTRGREPFWGLQMFKKGREIWKEWHFDK